MAPRYHQGDESVCGLLLAAGHARRFGSHKLLHPLPDGSAIGIASARHLAAALPHTLAVVRCGDCALAAALRAENVETVGVSDPVAGMGTSLARGVRASPRALGWVVALGDMPFIDPKTIALVAAQLHAGALLAAPVYDGRRGHPVGFSRALGCELRNLRGDAGGREILERHGAELCLVPVDDPGILKDIDHPAQLPRLPAAG